MKRGMDEKMTIEEVNEFLEWDYKRKSNQLSCENRGCCYGPGGGTSKCAKCDREYKEFVYKVGIE